MKHQNLTLQGIAANLNVMHRILTTAAQCLSEASSYAQSQQQNTAIGSMLAVEDMLQQAEALYRAIIAIHRFKTAEAPCE